MYEKKFKAVPPQAFTANGTSLGSLQIADASLFKVKQQVVIKATAQPDLYVEIKRIEAAVPHLIYVGDPKKSIDDRTDLSAYTIVAAANISIPEDQKRPSISADDHERAVYEEEPTVAKRVILVDKFGNKIDQDNPLPVDVEIVVGDVTVDVALDAFTKIPADNVVIVGTEDGTLTGVKHAVRVDAQGSVQTKSIQVFTKPFDAITATYPSATQEVYQSRIGGIGGTVQETATINYTDSTKNFLLNLART